MTAVNPGDTDLEVWYELNEASGDALDVNKSNTATETGGTIGTTTGKTFSTARDFEISTTHYFELTDDADVTFDGHVDFSGFGWFNCESQPGNMALMGKYDTGNNREWMIWYDQSDDRMYFGVSNDGASYDAVMEANYGDIPLSTWLFFKFYHDAVNDLIGIGINNNAFTTTAHSTGCSDQGEPFRIGVFQAAGSPTWYWDGPLQGLAVYRKKLSDDNFEWAYNSGNGRKYTDLSGATPTFRPKTFISFRDLNLPWLKKGGIWQPANTGFSTI